MTEIQGSSDALRAAFKAVLEESAAVEREVAGLAARLAHLREAGSGLAGLLGQKAAQEVADAAGVRFPSARPAFSPRAADQGRRLREERQRLASGASPEELEKLGRLNAAKNAANRRLEAAARSARDFEIEIEATHLDPMADATSTDKVVELLREFDGKAIPRQMILEEFFRRGWVESSWKEPEAAIRMAIKRAVERGEAAAVAGGRYMHKTPDLFQAGSSEGGEA